MSEESMVNEYTTSSGTEREHLEDMEKELYVDHLVIEHEGFFSYTELQKVINDWLKSKNYFKEVVRSKEKVTEKGRNTVTEYIFQRSVGLKHKVMIVMELATNDMIDVDMEVDGKMRTINEGEVEVVLNGFLSSSLKASWETKAYAAFIRGIIDKYIYKLDRPERVEAVVGDTKDLAFKIRGFLKSYGARVGARHGHGEGHEEEGHGGEHQGKEDHGHHKEEHHEVHGKSGSEERGGENGAEHKLSQEHKKALH